MFHYPVGFYIYSCQFSFYKITVPEHVVKNFLFALMGEHKLFVFEKNREQQI